MKHGENNKYKKTIKILMGVVILLVLVMAYFFLVRPLTNNYILEKQTEAQISTYNFMIQDMVTQIQQNGYYQVPIGNQTLVLVPYQPAQQQGQINGTQIPTQ